MLSKAKEYLAAGLCVLPALRTIKHAAVAWKPYQSRLPTEVELDEWFKVNRNALCLITGKTSGNLEMLDFDNAGEVFLPWAEKIDQSLMDRLVIERSQSGGWHVVYRYESAVNASMKLAMRPEYDIGETFFDKGIEYAKINGKQLVVRVDKDGQKFVVVQLIETRGEAGLFLCDPTPGYQVVQGLLVSLPVITTEERDALLSAAWEFNQPIPDAATDKRSNTERVTSVATTKPITERPGDEFNDTADIRTLLKSHGWSYVETKGDGNECWRRPGKTNGISATLRHVDGHWQFYVFSSNAYPFEQNQSYSAFATYTMLEHNGDFESATRTLGSHGYGKPSTPESLGVDLSNFNKTSSAKNATWDELEYDMLSDLTRTELKFLWDQRLVQGKLNLLVGDGEVGKTWLVCYMCATISTGRNWPDGTPCKQGGCIYFASEDGVTDTLLPRIEDQGGDPRHICVPKVVKNKRTNKVAEFTMANAKALEDLIDKFEAMRGKGYIKLVIFDPITAFMGDIDEHKNNQVRAAFREIIRIADEKQFTMLGVGHPKKNAMLFGTAAEAFSGSIAYVNLARMVWNFYYDKDSDIRYMLPAKSNLIKKAFGCKYHVRDGVVYFLDTMFDKHANQYLEEYRGQLRKGRKPVDVLKVEEWLHDFLKDGEKRCGNKNDSSEADSVFGGAKQMKFSRDRIYEAAKRLNVIKRKNSLDGQWWWQLPAGQPSGEPPPEDSPEFSEWTP